MHSSPSCLAMLACRELRSLALRVPFDCWVVATQVGTQSVQGVGAMVAMLRCGAAVQRLPGGLGQRAGTHTGFALLLVMQHALRAVLSPPHERRTLRSWASAARWCTAASHPPASCCS